MIRRLVAIPAVVLVLAGSAGLGWTGTAHASGLQLTFQISDAEAYAYKASIAQPVVEIAPKCDPKSNKKYHCDSYDQQPNCPAKVAFGADSQPSDPQAPPNVDGISGGAGTTAGEDPTHTDVPQSSSIRLHRLYSDGALGAAGDVLQANGLASLQYVDLGSPPWTNPYSHTETDGFTNQDNYEERCYATDSNGNYDPKASSNAKPGDSFAHFFSHSYTTPETDHYSECFQSQCQFYFGITASHALTQIHLQQTGDIVRGMEWAQLDDLQFPGGAPFAVHEIQTYVQFESDGTADGLRWQAVTTAQGATLGGQPVFLHPGDSFTLGNGDQAVSFGLAGPYAQASKDGGDLSIVAPGLYFASNQQTAFFGGAELTANFGRAPGPISFALPPSFAPPPPPTGTGGTTGTSTGTTGQTTVGGTSGGFSQPAVPPPSSTGVTQQPAAQPQVALISKTDPPWAPVTIFAFGFLGLLIVFLKWAQQFEWGQDLMAGRTMRGFEWLYRAFVKT